MGKKIKARKSGSSLILTIPADIAELMGIIAGTELEISPFRTDSLELRIVK
jgi:antitoxin component of MazEF toxin-antitoxin module